MDIAIDVHSKVPSYQQLADQIRAAITAGEIEPRQAIPSLTTLTQLSGLAFSTVQKAVRSLERENLVYTVAGRGTFVSPRSSGPAD